MTRKRTDASLTVAGTNLSRLLRITRAAESTFAVTVVHTPHPTVGLNVRMGQTPICAVAELEPAASVVDVRALLDQSPDVRFVFLAERLPLRHALARIIREGGHAVLARDDEPLVIVATAAALLAAREIAR